MQRNIDINKTVIVSRQDMANDFKNMMIKVSDMIDRQPIYATFIYFQIGISEADKSCVFNTTSTNPKSNLITSLSFKKQCVGTANEMEIHIIYDPFNYGQDTETDNKDSSMLEALDDKVAQVMAWALDDNTSNGTNNIMRCWLQYGYNDTNDSNLISPKYQLYITGADSSMNASTGVIEYTFTAQSLITAHAESTFKPNTVSKDQPVITTVANVLYEYYGNPNQQDKPSQITANRSEKNSDLKYNIHIDASLFDTQRKFKEDYCVTSLITPFTYCNNILNEYNLNQPDFDSGNYSDDKAIYNNKPYYALSIIDSNKNDGTGDICLSYVTPSNSQSQNITIDFPITWSNNKNRTFNVLIDNKNVPQTARPNNLVIDWRPETDLRLYILQKMVLLANNDNIKIEDENDSTSKVIAEAQKNKSSYAGLDAIERYDATLDLVGIPAEPPLMAELKILPVFLQKVSRTAGVYAIKSVTDTINTNGVFRTSLTLQRLRGLEEKTTQISTKTSKAVETDAEFIKNLKATNPTNEEVEAAIRKRAKEISTQNDVPRR